MNNNKITPFIFIVLFFFLHILYINTPFVNYEWVYRVGSQSIVTSNLDLLNLYFSNQSNPITYSLLSIIPLLLFGDHYATYRIISLVGGTLLLISLVRYRKPFLILIVGLNPLIWIYSGRAYSELISVGIMMMALETNRNGIIKGILGAFAAAIKYHSIVICGSYWGLRCLEKIIKHKSIAWQDKNFLAGIISICGLFTFFLIYYQELGVWIISDKYLKIFFNSASVGIFPTNFLIWISNFFSYGFYLGGMFFLTIPFHLRSATWRWQLLTVLISLLLVIFNQIIPVSGEIGFGSFENFLGSKLILLIKLFGFWNFIICILHFWKKDESRIMLITVIICLVIFSLIRPAQRYLIFVIPFWAVMICKHIDLNNPVKWGYILLFCGLNFFATQYQIQNSIVSKGIATWVQKNNITINENYAGSTIRANVGLFAQLDPHSINFVALSAQPGHEVLYKKTLLVFGYPVRTYYILRP